MSLPGERHCLVSANSVRILGNYTFQRRKGYVLSNDPGLIVERDPDTIRGPDVALYDELRQYRELSVKYPDRAPRMIVEVLSPNDRAPQVIRRITANLVPAAANARQYARIVREHAMLRGLLDTTRGIQEEVFGFAGEPHELLEKAEAQLYRIAHDDRTGELRSIEAVLHDELAKLERVSREGVSITGTPSGFKDIDDLTGGFQPGNLIVLAARPAMGKSALATNIAQKAAVDYSRGVALFSLEMSETELAQRFIAAEAKLNGDDLRKGRVRPDRWPKVVKATEKLYAAPLFIDDSSDMGVMELRAKARRLHSRQPLGLVIVDYLQLMRPEPGADSRVEQIGQISRGLKLLARELNIPVIAVSQLSRAVESRPDKRPLLSDLRESGQIEQDADLVMFIYRDEYYNEESDQQGIAEVHLAKHRNGPTDTVKLSFLKRYAKFADLAPAS